MKVQMVAVVGMMALLLSPVCGIADPTNTFQSTGSWTETAKWSLGHVPTNSETVAVAEGVTLTATGVATPYGGDLILGTNATFLNNEFDPNNALPSGGSSTIRFHDGSTFYKNKRGTGARRFQSCSAAMPVSQRLSTRVVTFWTAR